VTQLQVVQAGTACGVLSTHTQQIHAAAEAHTLRMAAALHAHYSVYMVRVHVVCSGVPP
jgi:short-subunit dehydrogenase